MVIAIVLVATGSVVRVTVCIRGDMPRGIILAYADSLCTGEQLERYPAKLNDSLGDYCRIVIAVESANQAIILLDETGCYLITIQYIYTVPSDITGPTSSASASGSKKIGA